MQIKNVNYWHPFRCFVCCLLVGYFWVSLGFAFVTAFSSPFGEAWVIYDPLLTICVYFLHCAFCFGCIVREYIPYLVF